VTLGSGIHQRGSVYILAATTQTGAKLPLKMGAESDADQRALGEERQPGGQNGTDTRPEGCVALLLAWIVSLVDVNQILRPHAV
jgi:hypothetical protein